MILNKSVVREISITQYNYLKRSFIKKYRVLNQFIENQKIRFLCKFLVSVFGIVTNKVFYSAKSKPIIGYSTIELKNTSKFWDEKDILMTDKNIIEISIYT